MGALNDVFENGKIYQLVTDRFQGGLSQNEVSEKTIDMNPELIELILDLYNNDEDFPFEKIKKFSIEEILAYLQATHRFYLTKKLPEIEQSMVHIFSKYGQSHQLLASLAYFFNDYKNKLIEHIRMEEREFFPYIKQLIEASDAPLEVRQSLKNNHLSIKEFIEGHASIEDELQEVSQLIKRYSGNEPLPLPFKIFLNQVEIFELELRKHAIIEDHVLVPMAQELEKRL